MLVCFRFPVTIQCTGGIILPLLGHPLPCDFLLLRHFPAVVVINEVLKRHIQPAGCPVCQLCAVVIVIDGDKPYPHERE